MNLFFLIPGLVLTLFCFDQAQCKTIDANATTFPSSRASKMDVYELSETYPNLKSVEIDTEKDKISNLVLSGQFPVLRSIEVDGNTTDFTGDFVGFFPVLFAIDINLTSAKCRLDLTGTWEQDVRVAIKATSGDVFLKLPDTVGVQVKVTTTSGKISNSYLKSVLDWRILTGGKTFENTLYKTAKVRIEIDLEVTSGNVYLR